MLIISRLKVRVISYNAIAIKTVVMALVKAIARPIVGTTLWKPTSSRVILLIPFRKINQVHLVITAIRLIWLSKKTEFKNSSAHRKAYHYIE